MKQYATDLTLADEAQGNCPTLVHEARGNFLPLPDGLMSRVSYPY